MMEDIPPEITQYTDQSLSRIHHALRTSRRRLIIGLMTHRSLTHADESDLTTQRKQPNGTSTTTVSVRSLAKDIVAIEENVPRTQATGDTYHSVYTSLIQSHLPELHDLRVITYDENRKRVHPDQNLIPVAMVAAVTSPVVSLLFQSGLRTTQNGSGEVSDSTAN